MKRRIKGWLGVAALIGSSAVGGAGILEAGTALFSFFHTKEMDKGKEPKLSVEFVQVQMDKPLHVTKGIGMFGRSVMDADWEVLVANASDAPVTIKDFDANSYLYMQINEKFGIIPMHFRNRNDMVLSIREKDSNKDAIPTRIDGHDFRRWIVHSRVEISPYAEELLGYEIRYRPETTLKEAENILLKSGTDFFTNLVKIENGQRHVDYTLAFPDKGTLELTLMTDTEGPFRGRGFWYGLNQ
ncbi:hypothetical protein [Nitrospirillum pindoramense]|uniref:Uncharacterized protein n=1 Tax=Nitrospirillum amazonense TaxID=28077 RepID=A0A560GK51_9PROT|nr:hypothetical protein [Nitrospirillum amazonense]TWB34316.1 hypothetical protein FBZ90_12616 [Nitrospirillum amazonense]